jgi:hypothetical protein
MPSHGPFISCASEVVHRAGADATEEGYATMTLLDQMTTGVEGAALVVGTDEVVAAGRRLAYHNHQRNARVTRAL